MAPRVTERTIRAVDRALAQRYSEKPFRSRGAPLDGLIQTILSQNTTDVNSGAAFRSLKQRFPTWEQARLARVGSIARAIEGGGLANIKAQRIKDILNQLHGERGETTLDFVCNLGIEEAREFLESLTGVGPKTAACVLLFNCGRPVIPVDTHVHRVAGRLGWLPEGSTAERAHQELQELVPDDLIYQLHLNMVAHGRDLCRPSNPRCPDCPILRWCPFGRERVRSGDAGA